MVYEGAVYRPPSEARSFILQVTIGCARNECTFCSMYKEKQFRIRKMDEIMADIDEIHEAYGDNIRKIFLADGDALIVPTERLVEILRALKERFPSAKSITSYGAPLDVLAKTDEELRLLKANGLDMVYMGLESGDDEVLVRIKKNATSGQIIEAGQRLRAAGIKISITVISGLGSHERFNEHALGTAKAVSLMKPEYLGFLTLHLAPPAQMYYDVEEGRFIPLSADEIMDELELFLSNTDSEGTVFRSNHASNYLPLAGTLNADTPALLETIRRAREHSLYRPDWYRQL